MSDAYGNYTTGLTDPLVGYVPPLAGPDYYGSGNPNGVVTASPGATYVDTAAGALYFKQTGTDANGWTLVVGGGSGSIYQGTGNPNGVVTASSPAVFYTTTGQVWVKTSGSNTNTGWEQVIN